MSVFHALRYDLGRLVLSEPTGPRQLKPGDVLELDRRGHRSTVRICRRHEDASPVVVSRHCYEALDAFAQRCERQIITARWVTYEPQPHHTAQSLTP